MRIIMAFCLVFMALTPKSEASYSGIERQKYGCAAKKPKNCLFLGAMYEDGTDVPQDYVKAYMSYSLAEFFGKPEVSKSAVKLRDLVAKIMTAEQITEAQNLASECMANNLENCL